MVYASFLRAAAEGLGCFYHAAEHSADILAFLNELVMDWCIDVMTGKCGIEPMLCFSLF